MEEDDPPPAGAPAWMATFGDLMSLLLCFFVLLFSMAVVDVVRFDAVIDSIRGTFGSSRPEDGQYQAKSDRIIERFKSDAQEELSKESETLEGELLQMMERIRVAGSVEVESGEGGVRVVVDGDMLFGPGTSAVDPRAFIFLDELGAVLRSHNHRIAVEGHTDSTPSGGSFPSNFHLSSARSLSVLLYLAEVTNLPPGRLSAVAYGDTRPVAPNTTPEGRRRNRRVEFFFQKHAAAR